MIGGHLRLKVATLLGFTEVPVVYLNIPEIEREKELNLRLNKNVGAWDEELLKAFDTDMLLDVGFTPDGLNFFFDDVLEIQEDGFNVEEELTKIVTPETKPGKYIALEEHRFDLWRCDRSRALSRKPWRNHRPPLRREKRIER